VFGVVEFGVSETGFNDLLNKALSVAFLLTPVFIRHILINTYPLPFTGENVYE
jgi:hypothetical protein